MYDSSKQKVTKPVSIYDVQRSLGTSERDLGSIATSSLINKWARFKPISRSGPGLLPYEDIKRPANNFGLELLSISSGTLNAFVTAVKEYVSCTGGRSQTGRYVGWADGVHYRRPAGGLSGPYRLSDFACIENASLGYKHSAPLLWTAPGKSAAIGTAIADGAEIDLSLKGEDDPLPDDSAALGSVSLDVDISAVPSQQTEAYCSVSALELLRNIGCPTTAKRGLILTDGGTAYVAIGSIPWTTWKQNDGDSVVGILGTWTRLDFYTTLSSFTSLSATGGFWLIPGMTGSVRIIAGSNSLVFAQVDEFGYYYSETKTVGIRFRLAGGDISNFDSVRAYVGSTSGGSDIRAKTEVLQKIMEMPSYVDAMDFKIDDIETDPLYVNHTPMYLTIEARQKNTSNYVIQYRSNVFYIVF